MAYANHIGSFSFAVLCFVSARITIESPPQNNPVLHGWPFPPFVRRRNRARESLRRHAVAIDILLVEDNEGDIRLMREILREINPTARLHVVADGAEAMDFLQYQGRYLVAPRPHVILLELNLPKLHGREVLARVKANPHTQAIPVIVLTSSEEECD